LNPVTAAPAAFRPSTTTVPGTWNGGSRVLSGFFSGAEVVLQVRVWDGIVAGSYEEAAALNFLGTQHGASATFTYTIPSASSATFLFYIENFRSFTLVPEPGVIALTILGVGGLLLLNWRKS
jgi:hypothetical protein